MQRVAIARALIHGPALLLLDEPFTGLDSLATDQVIALLGLELGRGRALVLVSHQVREVWPLATHAHALFRGGWTITGPVAGTAEEFLARYGEGIRG